MTVYVITWKYYDNSGFGIYGVYENKYLADHIYKLIDAEVQDKEITIIEKNVVTGQWTDKQEKT